MLVLTPPVDAPPAKPFAYAAPFAAHQHRGLDFATARGQTVRAPCTGHITFTGTLPTGDALTLRCRSLTVTLLGAAGAERRHASRGEAIAHTTSTELHLGVRRTADRFGYVDPEPLLRRATPAPHGPPAMPPRHRPKPPPLRTAPAPVTSPQGGAVAPAPVWLGVVLVLTATAGLRLRRRRRFPPWHDPSTSKSSPATLRRWRASTSARSAGR